MIPHGKGILLMEGGFWWFHFYSVAYLYFLRWTHICIINLYNKAYILFYCRKVNVKGAQSCLTLCDPMDYTVSGILQARVLEWVAFPISRRSSQPRDQTQVSRIAGQVLYQLSHRVVEKPIKVIFKKWHVVESLTDTSENVLIGG